MTLTDIPDVMVVNQRCFVTPWSAWAIRFDFQRNQNSHWVVLEWLPPVQNDHFLRRLWSRLQNKHTAQIIGFAGFWIVNGESHITSIGVDPAHQGMGWGRLLLTSILRYSMVHGAEFASLEVRVSNHTAIRLYEQFQYKIVGRKPQYYHDNREDAFDMATPRFDTHYHRLLDGFALRLSDKLRWRDYFVRGGAAADVSG